MRDISTIKDQKIRGILLKVEERMKHIFSEKLKKVILYGSYARNEQERESDIDIMLLIDLGMEELNKYQAKVTDAIYDLEIENDIVVSVTKASYDNYNKYIDVLPFYTNIRNEGVEIYG